MKRKGKRNNLYQSVGYLVGITNKTIFEFQLKKYMNKFIKIENKNIDIEKRDVVFAQYKRFFGELPEHLELLGNVDPEILSDFLKYNMKLMRNKKFHVDFFTLLRIHIAIAENYSYCLEFNTKILLQKGYTKESIATFSNTQNLPLPSEQKILAEKAKKAIFDSVAFNKNDLEELYQLGWDIGEVYDAIEHIGIFEKNSRFIRAFMV
ncbi:MAG: hypothetical protein GQ527_07095 [Bacteroidales bacterium]|nr:hypothetical protein [Bacteroidales bacterium]